MVYRERQRAHKEEVHVSTNPYLSMCPPSLLNTLRTCREAQPSEQTYIEDWHYRKSVAGTTGIISVLNQTTSKTLPS